MNDEELIDYCDMHSESDRALFSGSQINRMLELAGHPESFARRVSPNAWISMHDEMKTLCFIARARIRMGEEVIPQVPCKIIQFPGTIART